MKLRAALPLTMLLLLTACGPSAKDFQSADPSGYEACYSFDRSIGAGGDYRRNAERLAADKGLEASTDSIRDALDSISDGANYIADHKALRKACKAAGFPITK